MHGDRRVLAGGHSDDARRNGRLRHCIPARKRDTTVISVARCNFLTSGCLHAEGPYVTPLPLQGAKTPGLSGFAAHAKEVKVSVRVWADVCGEYQRNRGENYSADKNTHMPRLSGPRPPSLPAETTIRIPAAARLSSATLSVARGPWVGHVGPPPNDLLC